MEPDNINEIEQEEIAREERKWNQINKAREYLKQNNPKDGSEPTLEWCIISQLLKIIQ